MQIGKSLLVLLLILTMSGANAQTTSSKGVGNEMLNDGLTPEVKTAAIREASINALDRYFAGTNQAKAKNYELVREDLVGSIESYVLSVGILSEDIDGIPLEEMRGAESGLYTVVVRAEINTNRLNNELKSRSVIANTATQDKSLLTFVFVARQQSSVQRFDDKVYKRTDVNANMDANRTVNNKTTESEQFGANSISLQDSNSFDAKGNVNATVAVTSGGSTTTKADVIQWDVTRASEINNIMTGVFSNAGFEVVEAEYLEEESGGLLDLAAIRNDYKTGDDLAPATKRNVAKGVKKVEIPYVALGTLDVGMKSMDPVSGLVRVFVTVSGKILDVSGRFPKTAAAVGPRQFAGLGVDETVARTNALTLAAKSAAKQLTDELNAKGFQ